MDGKVMQNRTPKGGSFVYMKDGNSLAEMVYTSAGEKLLIIEHTDVDESLKGQGIGKILLEALVQYARQASITVIPLCPFSQATFKKMPEWQDVLSGISIKNQN